MDRFRLCVFVMMTMQMAETTKLISDTVKAQEFLDKYNSLMEKVFFKASEASWNFNINITDYNKELMMKQDDYSDKVEQEAAVNASRYDVSVMPKIMRREFVKVKDIGVAAQPNEAKRKRLNEVMTEMNTIYSTAKVCLKDAGCLPLEPDLTRIFAKSRDYNQLLSAWKGWRWATGAKMKHLYPEYVSLSNEALRLLGYTDTGAYWRSSYDTPNFEHEVQALYEQLHPLYEQLHAYVRRKLKAVYGREHFPESGHIPAHLLGNMWAQSFQDIADLLIPYKGKQSMNVTQEMKNQNYTPVRIFKLADDFFASLGLSKVSALFWRDSMLQRPKDGRQVMCHATSWDFSNKKDFRVSDCTDITQEDIQAVHHEMGHIQYYMQYKELPIQFRSGANPGFHEAVGSTISLSVQTPKHMKSIGLLREVRNDTESDINFLMSMALERIAFLPFGYLIDQWRWSVFRGDTTPEQYNSHWWNLRCRFQGVSSPVERRSTDFDPGAKNHIATSTPYIRYFVSAMLQFQFHKALCDAAGHSGPLHRCDIYNSKDAGTLLRNMLKLGSSVNATVALKTLTGSTKLDAQPLMDYFQPLLEFLRRENGNDYGWQPSCPVTTSAYTNNAASVSVAYLLDLILISMFAYITLKP